MTLGLAFWVLWLVALVFGVWSAWPVSGPYHIWGGNLLLFVLITILGWHAFGPPIHG